MKIVSISLPEIGHSPDKITVVMSTREALFLAKTLGKMTPVTTEINEIYACLTGEFFNRFWDDGVNEASADAGEGA